MGSCTGKSTSSASKKSSPDVIGMLNDEQRELVIRNHNLIYAALRKYKYPVSEFYDVAAIGLCKAAMWYNDDIYARFSVVAFKFILNECRSAERSLRRHNADYNALSYEENIGGYSTRIGRNGYGYSTQSCRLVCNDDEELFEIVFCRVVDDMVEDCEDSKCRTYFKLHNMGLNDTEVARKMGMQRYQVLYLKEKLIKFLRKKLKIKL